MSANAEQLSDRELAAALWDLEPLVDGGGPGGARRFLDDAAARSADFAGRHFGRVAELDAGGLTAAMLELSAVREVTMRAFIYAQLAHEGDLDDEAASALYQAVAERRLEIEQTVRFFELEWAALSPTEMERLLDSAGTELEFAAHH